ncbi:hypothetical protein BDP27DRAFT_1368416 [Rhodocollybia butyracea]|uniref:Uncharacterized protein n=1 Tax=Rhodocollybia butyracea TaxID=206335 RepID=A0A9P5PGW0_9AGAR|nr:hypothetical protein BDP27DRAFT_1368416 [Rhodocollybia butyracea]
MTTPDDGGDTLLVGVSNPYGSILWPFLFIPTRPRTLLEVLLQKTLFRMKVLREALGTSSLDISNERYDTKNLGCKLMSLMALIFQNENSREIPMGEGRRDPPPGIMAHPDLPEEILPEAPTPILYIPGELGKALYYIGLLTWPIVLGQRSPFPAIALFIAALYMQCIQVTEGIDRCYESTLFTMSFITID